MEKVRRCQLKSCLEEQGSITFFSQFLWRPWRFRNYFDCTFNILKCCFWFLHFYNISDWYKSDGILAHNSTAFFFLYPLLLSTAPSYLCKFMWFFRWSFFSWRNSILFGYYWIAFSVYENSLRIYLLICWKSITISTRC